MYRKPKIALIGGGKIGGTIAHLAATRDLAEIILFDILTGLSAGKVLDIQQSLAIAGLNAKLKGTSNYQDIKGSDVIIVTAGASRTPEMSRGDLIAVNSKIIYQIALEIKRCAPEALVIMVTNPLDLMVYLLQKVSGLPASKIVGMAGTLDSARLNGFLATEFNVAVENVSSLVLGSHNDLMIPLVRYATISGIPVLELVKMGWSTDQKIAAIVERTRNGGGEIVSLLKTSSAYYAPAAAALEIAESYLKDQRKLLTCAAYLNGEYGHRGFYLGVPVIIGSNGVEKIIEVALNSTEKAAFDLSARSVKQSTESMIIPVVNKLPS